MRSYLLVFVCLIVLTTATTMTHQPVVAHPASDQNPLASLTSTTARLHAMLPQTQQEPQALTDMLPIDTVIDWQNGFLDNTLITNNDGGELRLDVDQTAGMFISRPLSTTFDLNAAGAFWRADIPDDTNLVLELRGRSSTPDMLIETFAAANAEPGWTSWQPLIAADARSKADDGAFANPDVLEFPPDTRYLQLRVSLSSDRAKASPILNEITIAYLNTMQGPPAAQGLPRAPIIFGPDTLTPRPMHIPRTKWSARRIAAQMDYQTPFGIILYQIDANPSADMLLPLLRSLATYQTAVLGWDDMTYHYLIDQAGNIYEGRMGGPNSNIARLSGGDTSIHIGLINNLDADLSTAARETLTHLLAWLCQAYDIAPLEQHAVVRNNRYTMRENIAAHNTFEPQAPDPGAPVRELLPALRSEVDQAMTRSRWYFPEGNVQEYRQSMTFFNTSSRAAEVTVELLSGQTTTPLTESITLTARGHATLQVNDILSGTASLSAIVNSNRPIIAERNMQLPTDINVNSGVSELSRIWYFPEGSTDDPFSTYLVLFNPHEGDTNAIITYMKGDGTQAEQRVLIRAQQRVVITVNDVLPGVGFGTRIIASRPIAADRTMRFGPGNSGMHMGPGITELSRWWFFAEGTTDPPFIMRLLVLNPNAQPSHTTITFMTPDGTSLKRNYAIPPTTRLVVDVNEVVPTLGIATIVESDRPVAAERALYFDARQLETESVSATTPSPTTSAVVTSTTNTTDTATLTETLSLAANAAPMAGTVSFGATQPSYSWYFAHGTTLDAQEFLLLGNPDRAQAQVTVSCVLDDGSVETQEIVMPSESRYTFAVHDYYPDQPVISCMVESTQRIVAERSIYQLGETHGGSTSSGVAGE